MKIHVHIRRFTCCLNIGFKLENTKSERQVIYMMVYAESVADQTDYFANAFVRENIAYGCDEVLTFESLHGRHLF